MIVSDAQVLTHFIDTKVLVTPSCPTFDTLWNVTRQAPLSIGSSRQEFWSGSPCSPLGDLPDLGIKPASPVLQEDSLLSEPSNGRSYYNYLMIMSPQTYWHLRIENNNHLVTSTLTRGLWLSSLTWLLKMLCWNPFGSLGYFGVWDTPPLPWPCSKPFSVPNSDIWVCFTSLCIEHMNLHSIIETTNLHSIIETINGKVPEIFKSS